MIYKLIAIFMNKFNLLKQIQFKIYMINIYMCLIQIQIDEKKILFVKKIK